MPEPEIVGARTGSAREADVGGICRRVLVVPTTPLEAGSGEGVTVMVIANAFATQRLCVARPCLVTRDV